jgi:cyclophilin family peptidyl-prolyl cis-trans isomerase
MNRQSCLIEKHKLVYPLFLILSLAMVLLVFTSCSSSSKTPTPAGQSPEGGIMQWSTPPAMAIDQNKEYTATIKTNYGDIVVKLLPKDAPIAVNSFVFLARQGYFDGIKFHRISKGFVIQGGDPTGSGSGGPGDEFVDEPVTRDYTLGTLAMANSGADTNGSQFFITLADLSGRLDKNYTIFGHVSGGLDVVQKIANVPVKYNPALRETSLPTVDVHIETVVITEK